LFYGFLIFSYLKCKSLSIIKGFIRPKINKMRAAITFIVLLISFNLLMAQQTKPRISWVNGIVLNANREPVKKAVIYLDSIKTKIKTNKKGQFRIGLKPNNKTVSAYAWRYGIHTVVLDGEIEEMLIVFPKNEAVMSEEQLAELGFDTRKKTRKKKEPKDYSEYLNMYQLIATEVPGAQVSGTTIRLRGNAVNSVNSGQEPLIIVDGTVAGSLENIFPREVASVKVLREQNASIYGVRGANGVILIEMKK